MKKDERRRKKTLFIGLLSLFSLSLSAVNNNDSTSSSPPLPLLFPSLSGTTKHAANNVKSDTGPVNWPAWGTPTTNKN